MESLSFCHRFLLCHSQLLNPVDKEMLFDQTLVSPLSLLFDKVSSWSPYVGPCLSPVLAEHPAKPVYRASFFPLTSNQVLFLYLLSKQALLPLPHPWYLTKFLLVIFSNFASTFSLWPLAINGFCCIWVEFNLSPIAGVYPLLQLYYVVSSSSFLTTSECNFCFILFYIAMTALVNKNYRGQIKTRFLNISSIWVKVWF